MTAPARRVDREWHEQPTVIVVTYRNGQPERVKPNFQSASRAGVPDGVVHQLASHEHRVLTHRQKLPIHTSRLDDQTCPTRRGQPFRTGQVEVPGNGRGTPL